MKCVLYIGPKGILCSLLNLLKYFLFKKNNMEYGSKIYAIKQELEIRIFGPLFDPLSHKREAWKLGNAIS
jgi:hypothetical protein